MIETSRTIPTKNLANLICGLENKPSVFIQGSAIGFYGDRADEILDEDSVIGDGYLPETCKSGKMLVQNLKTRHKESSYPYWNSDDVPRWGAWKATIPC